jgi:hypothetical protein
MTASSPPKFRRSPKPTTPAPVASVATATVATVSISGRIAEKVPRDWSVKEPDSDFIQQIFVTCKSLVKAMHGAGNFALAVYDLKPPQLAFYWVSETEDLVLIFPTHSRVKNGFTKTDLSNLEKSFTWEFENHLAIALMKERKVSYQFLQIEKVNRVYQCVLTKPRESCLWYKLFGNDSVPVKHSHYQNAYVDRGELVVYLRTTSLSIKERHEYRFPLNQMSENVKNSILKSKEFERVIPHGHTHSVNGENVYDRHFDVEHPAFEKILRQHRGDVCLMDCVSCGSSMFGLHNDTICALCAAPTGPQAPVEKACYEYGPMHFKVINNKS